MEGYISLHRKIFRSDWSDDYKTNYLFIYCIVQANHKDGSWRGMEVKRGQFVTSYQKLSQATGLSVQMVRNSLNKLKSTNNITSKTTNKYQVITITNYEKYQDNNKQTTDNQQADNNQTTKKQQTNNNQSTTNNNENNNNNDNNEEYITPYNPPGDESETAPAFDHQRVRQQFEAFWKEYKPIKVDKGSKSKAEKIFNRLMKKEENYEEIMRGLARYRQFTESSGQYTQAVTTWLNGRCWENEYAVAEPERAADQRGNAGGQYAAACARILAGEQLN